MPSPSKSRVAKSSVGSPSNPTSRAPFGFVFFLLLLASVFAFSTFYVVSQTTREQQARHDLDLTAAQLDTRVNTLQGQINHLSAQLTIQQDQIERLTPKGTTNTLPITGTRK